MSAGATAKNAGVLAVVVAVLGVIADLFGVFGGLGFDSPINLHDKLFPSGPPGSPPPSATTATASPRPPAPSSRPSAPSSRPSAPSSRPSAPRTTTRAEPEPAPTAAHPASVTRAPRPKGSVLGTPLSGPGRPSGIFASSTGCSFGDCISVDDPVDIGRRGFASGWKFQCTIGCTDNWQMSLDVLLNGKYSRLNATLGIANSSPDSDHKLGVDLIDVSGNSVLYHADLAYGSAKTLQNFDVAGVVKLRVRFSGALAYTNGAVGSPVLYP